jgi:hypothetical protein
MALESEHEFQGVVEHDVEKQQTVTEGKHTRSDGLLSIFAMREGEVYEAHPEKNPRWYQRLLDSGFEENGIKPVPLESRTSTKYNNLFTVLFTSLMCLLP